MHIVDFQVVTFIPHKYTLPFATNFPHAIETLLESELAQICEKSVETGALSTLSDAALVGALTSLLRLLAGQETSVGQSANFGLEITGFVEKN